QGAMIGLVIAAGMNFFSYWNSDKMVLSAYKAQEVTESTDPRLYKIVRDLAMRAGLPMPKVYITPEQQPNAFATGRDPKHAAVACTQGLLNMMTDEEIAGVLGHELGHVKHRDILIGTVAATFAGAISYVSKFAMYMPIGNTDENGNRRSNPLGLILMILAPIAASVIQMTISRRREFLADRFGGEIAGNPLYLRDALAKLESYSGQIQMNQKNPSYSHMFIVNPLKGFAGLADLFRTHPKTEDRIRELERQAFEQGKLK
ncbi:MAG: zinc metalloprotease HtpX, partial [Leptotrichiaceae bacterium]